MRKEFLDTNRLIEHYQRMRAGRPHRQVTDTMVAQWAKDLIRLRRVNLILTPVVIEFLAGAGSSREVQLGKAFLAEFEIADGGDIRGDDWVRAQQFAERVPGDGKPRDLGDCILAALAERLGLDADTGDHGFPKRAATRRRRRR